MTSTPITNTVHKNKKEIIVPLYSAEMPPIFKVISLIYMPNYASSIFEVSSRKVKGSTSGLQTNALKKSVVQ